MRYVVLAGGAGIDRDRIAPQISGADHILCADEGAVHARKMGVIPDRIVGDMDSIDSQTLEWARKHHIPTEVFPEEKDLTDSELCFAQVPTEGSVLFVLPMCGRFDHVLSNILIAARYAREGRDIILTDGRTRIYPVIGPNQLTLDVRREEEWIGADKLIVSILPILGPAENIRSSGLHYPIDGFSMAPGISLGVSNRPAEGAREFTVTLASGVLLVIVTSEDYLQSP